MNGNIHTVCRVCNKEYAFDVSLLNLSRICSWDFEAEVRALYFAERWKNFLLNTDLRFRAANNLIDSNDMQ